MGSGHESGEHLPPTGWQATVREHGERPVQMNPTWFIPGLRAAQNYEVRVARERRANGHTAIAGSRCLDAGTTPPPRFLALPDCCSVHILKLQLAAHHTVASRFNP